MAYPAPTLADFEGAKGDEAIVVSLSKLPNGLIVKIPDSADLPPQECVYATLWGDEPDRDTDRVDVAHFIEETQTYEKVKGLNLRISKNEINPYLDTTVDLRYHSMGESGLPTSSAPLKVRIVP